MIPTRLLEILACPRDVQPMRLEGGELVCPAGHRYPVVDDVPVLLLHDVSQTHAVATESLRAARSKGPRADALTPLARTDGVDPFVQSVISATGGYMYRPLVNRLREYPIPDFPLDAGGGRTLVDLGCNWGRWTLAAVRRGYRGIGIDPSLEAIQAAKRVSTQLGLYAEYLVGDARYLPFRSGSVEVVYSYSVLQHFEKSDVERALREVGRSLVPGGTVKIQMPNAFGVRSLYHQVRRGFRQARAFEVRYWTPAELRRVFGAIIGPARLSVDGFFSLNAQITEARLLPFRYRTVVEASDRLRRISRSVPALTTFADSLYVEATRRA